MKRRDHGLFVLYGCLAGGAALMFGTTAGCGDDSSGAAPSVVDATADTKPTAPDAMEDSHVDAGTATMSDGPSGFADVGDVAIAIPSLSQFPHAVDVAYCTRLQQCCMVPAADWNQTGTSGCVSTLDTMGGVLGLGGFASALESGHVEYDASAAKNCLDHVYSFSCGAVPASAIAFTRDVCFGAMHGTLGAGAGPCVSSLECASGLYCRVVSGGGPGTCVALQGQGQACADTTASTDCTYLGNGTPALFCFDPGDGGTPTCEPALPLDAGPCNQAAACQSWACNYPTCVGTIVFSDPGAPNGTCAAFSIDDAGAE